MEKAVFDKLLESFKKEEIERTGIVPNGFYGHLAFHKKCERKLLNRIGDEQAKKSADL